MLEKDNSPSIHHKNLQLLAAEMHRASNTMCPTILNDIYASRATPYNLHDLVSFKMGKVYLVYNSTETLSHLGRKTGSLVPQEIRQSVSLGDFKSKIKNRLHLIVLADYAQKYLHEVGFI